MREIPWSVLLTFPMPNYKNPETRGNAIIIINAIMIFLVLVCVGLRLYTRLYIKRWFGLDDIFIIPATLCTVGLCAVVILANTRYGWSRHVWDIPLKQIPKAGKIAFIAKLMFTLAATFTRISLLTFYYRLVGESRVAWFKWAIHSSMAFIIAIGISFIGLVVWQCSPVSAYWSYPMPKGAHCMDEGMITLVCGIINCVADLLVTVLPIPVVMKLKMPMRQRVGVVCLLSLGFIVTIAGVVRTYYIWKSLVDSYDQTWFAYPLWIAAAVEIDLSVICACAPALRPLLGKAKVLTKVSQKISSAVSTLSTIRGSTKDQSSKSFTNASSGYNLSVLQTGKDDVDEGHLHPTRLQIMKHESFRISEFAAGADIIDGFEEKSNQKQRPVSRLEHLGTTTTVVSELSQSSNSRPSSELARNSNDSQHWILPGAAISDDSSDAHTGQRPERQSQLPRSQGFANGSSNSNSEVQGGEPPVHPRSHSRTRTRPTTSGSIQVSNGHGIGVGSGYVAPWGAPKSHDAAPLYVPSRKPQ